MRNKQDSLENGPKAAASRRSPKGNNPGIEVDADDASKLSSSRVDLFFRELDPGLITGCADDDPSGISTYAIAGAAFGYATLWTALISFPLMVCVQMMCSRLGMVTGRGLAVIRLNYPRWILWGACFLLMTANVFNIAADLGGMGESAAMVTGVKAKIRTVFFTGLIVSFLF
jgi:Mn2+/Fe2+ NRAMP family transporter